MLPLEYSPFTLPCPPTATKHQSSVTMHLLASTAAALLLATAALATSSPTSGQPPVSPQQYSIVFTLAEGQQVRPGANSEVHLKLGDGQGGPVVQEVLKPGAGKLEGNTLTFQVTRPPTLTGEVCQLGISFRPSRVW